MMDMTRYEPVALVRNYRELHTVLRARAEEIGMTRQTTDAEGGLSPGYAGKVLAPTPVRSVGMVSLGPLLNLFGFGLLVVKIRASATAAPDMPIVPPPGRASRD